MTMGVAGKYGELVVNVSSFSATDGAEQEQAAFWGLLTTVCQLCSGEFGGALDRGGSAGYIYAIHRREHAIHIREHDF
jgi:hypothetical protein